VNGGIIGGVRMASFSEELLTTLECNEEGVRMALEE